MRYIKLMSLLMAGACLTGCAALWAGAGAGAAGAAYEGKNKHDLEKLEDSYKDGGISQDEYLRRRDEIEDRSLVY